jgi:hypothetical protein
MVRSKVFDVQLCGVDGQPSAAEEIFMPAASSEVWRPEDAAKLKKAAREMAVWAGEGWMRLVA